MAVVSPPSSGQYFPNGWLEKNPLTAAQSPLSSTQASGEGGSPTLPAAAPRKDLSVVDQANLKQLQAHMRQLVSTQGILVKMYMKDFDKTNRGTVSSTRFQRVLGMIFPSLTPEDRKFLARAYSSSEDSCHYMDLHRDVTAGTASAASTGAALSTEVSKPAPVDPAATLSAGFLGSDVDEVEAAIIRRVFERRIQVSSLFLDWDKLKRGNITRNQFIRGLTAAGLGLAAGVSPQGLDGLATRYALPGDNDVVSYARFAASVERAFCEPNMHTHVGPPPESFAHTVVTAPLQRSVRPQFDGGRARYLDTAIKDILIMITRRRLYNIKPRFVDFDPIGEGLVSESRFSRTLAQFGLVPDTQECRDALLDYFRDARKPDMIDYRAFLQAVATKGVE